MFNWKSAVLLLGVVTATAGVFYWGPGRGQPAEPDVGVAVQPVNNDERDVMDRELEKLLQYIEEETDEPMQLPVLEPEQALETFELEEGFRIELVASEPEVIDPVAMDIDPDGRLWVVEMHSYMPHPEPDPETEEELPVSRVVVLEDTTGDGQMDAHHVFADELVLPRAIKVLEDGVLVATPPELVFMQDTTGDGKADTSEVVDDAFDNPRARNVEHMANGLMWAMDNWLYNAAADKRYRRVDGQWLIEETEWRGQWGITQDNWGRILTNHNSHVLRGDTVPRNYYVRNPHLPHEPGIYERLTHNETIWPVRPTGINRGYFDHMLRDDYTVAITTATCGLVAYRGTQFPEAHHGNVYVPEPAGNLVKRLVLNSAPQRIQIDAEHAYDEKEFLITTDERSRIVNMYNAPDGTMYAVDMYRGLFQHVAFLTPYLRGYVETRGLHQPVAERGRIYRIVHEDHEVPEAPKLSDATDQELLNHLRHDNGWVRDTAQQLLVQRNAGSAINRLRDLALDGEEEPVTRLHALWTLEGIDGGLDAALVMEAMADPHPRVQADATQLAERWIDDEAHRDAIFDRVMVLAEAPADYVRLQALFTLGEFDDQRVPETFARVLNEHASNPYYRFATLSGLRGQEADLIERLIVDHDWASLDPSPGREDTLSHTARTIVRAEDAGQLTKLLNVMEQDGKPDAAAWWQTALARGVQEDIAGVSDDIALEAEPAGLVQLAAVAEGEAAEWAEQIRERLDWPGKGERRQRVELTEAQQERFDQGAGAYAACAACHAPDGSGVDGLGPALAGSEWVNGEPEALVRIVLQGFDGDHPMAMPAHEQMFADEDLAAILTYVRQSWGNEAAPVDPDQVAEIREATDGRRAPWTPDELAELASE